MTAANDSFMMTDHEWMILNWVIDFNFNKMKFYGSKGASSRT